MAARFEGHAAAVAESGELAARLTFDLTPDLGYRYPGAEDASASRKLAELCWALLEVRYPVGSRHHSAARARLDEELRVIDVLGLAGFFLLHRDLLELARDVAVEVRGPASARALLPPGRGRGSSVSSIVCYLTGLSHIDPIANDLFLGRFLNEELNALPDIDLDFPRDVREKLIPRVHDRYGKERSALVAAFPTFRSRGAIRELGKVLGLPPGELERVARGAEPWAVKNVGRDVEVAMGIEPSGEPGPFIDPDARASAFAMSTEEWLAMVNGKRPDQAEAHETSPETHSYDHLPGRWRVARAAVRRGLRAAAAPVAALGRDDRLDAAADRLLPGAAGGDGGPPALPVGQGLVRRRGVPEDRPARAGDAVRGRALRGGDRARARGAGRPLADSRMTTRRPTTRSRSRTRWASSRSSRGRRWRRCCGRGRGRLEDLTIQVAIVRPGPILGGAVNPYISRLQTLRENPTTSCPTSTSRCATVLKDTLGTIIFQDQVIEVAMAFAGFSPGEAEGLRRAMSRKRSAEAIEAYHQRFLDGAMATHGVGEEVAERVYGMIVGFSGFGFPKAHGAAFGLLAYQSTWLRVHHGPEFLCALMNEQPMGFYAPDTLAHEAQRRGIALAPAGRQREPGAVHGRVGAGDGPAALLDGARWSGAPGEPPAPEGAAAARLAAARGRRRRARGARRGAPGGARGAAATGRARRVAPRRAPARAWRGGARRRGARRVRAAPRRPGRRSPASPSAARAPSAIVRLGLGFILGVREEEIKALVAAREEGGPFRSLADLASRAGAGRPSLDRLAWAGACDSLIGGSSEHARRTALWQLGVAVPGERLLEGTQLALPLEVPDAPDLRPLTPWESMIGDYATTGLTLGPHPMQLLRPSLEPNTLSIGDLARLPHNTAVKLGGLVVARQRPGTAKGIVFLLLEDEFGTINLIVPPDLYEANRLTVRRSRCCCARGGWRSCRRRAAGSTCSSRRCGRWWRRRKRSGGGVALAEKRVAAAATGPGEGAQGGREAASTMGEFRQVSPPIQSFASGRRR